MLSSRSRLFVPAILGLSLAVAGGANAGMITYNITTNSSGSLGGISYAGSNVTLTFVGDTANVVNVESGVFYNSLGTATVSVEGLGTATFTEPISVYSYQAQGAVGFFNGSSFSSRNYTLGILNLTSSAYGSYQLLTSFRPAAGSSFTSFTPAGFATNRGAFVMSPQAGTFSATTSAVPEPSSFVMLGMGAVGCLGLIRLKARVSGR